MKKIFSYILLAIKGALFGVANLIPGVSGGTIAAVTGVYDKLIDSINNLFKHFLKSIIWLMIFAIGAVVAVLAGSKGIDYCINNYPIQTACAFIGLMLGGLPILFNKVEGKFSFKYALIMIISILVVCGLTFIPSTTRAEGVPIAWYEYLILAGLGFLASVAMVVPGISGMMMFKIFGYYDDFMSVLANLTKLDMLGANILFLLPIAVGIFIGIFTAAKVISTLFKKCPTGTYFAIIGFVIGSILVLFANGREFAGGTRMTSIFGCLNDMVASGNSIAFILDNWVTFAISLALIIIGYVAIYVLGELSIRNEAKLALNANNEVASIENEEEKKNE